MTLNKTQKIFAITASAAGIIGMCYAGLYTVLGIGDLKEGQKDNIKEIQKLKQAVVRIETKIDIKSYYENEVVNARKWNSTNKHL
jgi:hypothetical protein